MELAALLGKGQDRGNEFKKISNEKKSYVSDMHNTYMRVYRISYIYHIHAIYMYTCPYRFSYLYTSTYMYMMVYA